MTAVFIMSSIISGTIIIKLLLIDREDLVPLVVNITVLFFILINFLKGGF